MHDCFFHEKERIKQNLRATFDITTGCILVQVFLVMIIFYLNVISVTLASKLQQSGIVAVNVVVASELNL